MHWLIERIRDFDTKAALATEVTSVAYAELSTRISTCIVELDTAGVRPGESVAIRGDYSLGNIAALLACLARSLIAVPMTGVTDAEFETRCEIARVTRVFNAGNWSSRTTASASVPLLDALRERGRAGLVLFSSGSTGEPKALVHDLTTLADSYRERRAKSVSMVLFLLFDHIGGLNTLLSGLATGAKLLIPSVREPECVAALVMRHAGMVLPASPTFLNLMLLADVPSRYDLGSLRIITYGTEPMPEALLRRLREAFPKVKFIQTFGTSETGIARTVSRSSDSTWLKLDDPDQQWKLVEGELWLRSKTRALGYLNRDSDRFTDDGWFRTGDLVECADDGFVRIAGRLTELINVGGEKVMPGEVENVILEVAGVDEVLVRGEPNPITGSMVVADVCTSPSVDRDVLKRTIRSYCRGRLPAYKVPAKVNFIAEMPHGARFKKSRAGNPDTQGGLA